jgi:hypothetical protein
MERKLRDALPGGDGALRAAVREFMRPMLSPALVALNRDAFIVNESAESTVDLDDHRIDRSRPLVLSSRQIQRREDRRARASAAVPLSFCVGSRSSTRSRQDGAGRTPISESVGSRSNATVERGRR